MANAGDLLTYVEFSTVKGRVKVELARRIHYTNLSGYAGAAYDYVETEFISTEHINKLIFPLEAINTAGLPLDYGSDELIDVESFEAIRERLTLNESESVNNYAPSGNGDCGSACSGMCVNTCATGCTGCSGTCSGTCTGGCSGGCSGCSGCTGCSGCGTSCSTNCSSTCSGSCYLSSTGGCSDCTGGIGLG